MTTTSSPTSMQSTVTPYPSAEQRDSNTRFKEQAKMTTQDVFAMGERVKDSAEEKLGHLKETATEYLAQGQKKAKEVRISIQESIRANPLTYVLIAAGVGLALGVSACVTRDFARAK